MILMVLMLITTDFVSQGMAATTEYVSIHAALKGTIFFILSR